MHLTKQILSVALLFVLLIAIAVAPLLLAQAQNHARIGRVVVKTMPNEPVRSAQPSTVCCALERIRNAKQTIISVGEEEAWKEYVAPQALQKENDTEEQQTDGGQNAVSQTMSQNKRDVIKKLEQQIHLLQQKNALPALDFPQELEASVSKIIYLDTDNPADALSVWRVNVMCDAFFVQAYLDAETSLIYYISLKAVTPTASYDTTRLSETGFLEYLQIDPHVETEHGVFVDVQGEYTPQSVCLSIVSYESGAEQMTTYLFDTESNKRYATVEPYLGPLTSVVEASPQTK